MASSETTAGTLPERTHHRLCKADARALPLPDGCVDLVVTSPPYPMIEMWDETFETLDADVAAAMDRGDGWGAYERMHAILGDAWDEVVRVLRPGGVVCVNIGDATRSVDGAFRRYPNHVAVTRSLTERGLRPLPDLLWNKPTNGPTKFMGSMRPPNGYVTLEHEYILPFRKGGPRSVDGDRRQPSAYFWEERNRWFSDVWTVGGERQSIGAAARDRAGAFPPEIPYRLINMFSVQGDVVLDPFCGTGTTSLAAAASARHSIGCDRNGEFLKIAGERRQEIVEFARRRGQDRLRSHEAFVAERSEAGDPPEITARYYDTTVVTQREREIALPAVESVGGNHATWAAHHTILRDD